MRVHNTCTGRLRARRRRESCQRIEQIFDAEILQRRAEEHGSEMPFTERFEIERSAGLFHQLELVRDCRGVEHAISCRKRGQVERLPLNRFAVLADKPHLAGGKIAGSGKVAATANWPGQRRGIERKRFFDLVKQLERIPALAVHFVDERNDWYVA